MSSPEDRQEQIEHIAQRWVVRLTSDNVQPGDVEAARAWCEEHPEHRQAFVAARRLWQLSAHVALPETRRRARPIWRWATAAVLVLAVGLGLARHAAWDADYRTAQGEQRRIELEDGSRILLDAGSAVDVAFSADGRVITLRKGVALFEVAHDPSRPFRVLAGEVSATALGTVYAVGRLGDAIEVTVAQGRVAVKGAADRATLVAGEQVAWLGGALGAKLEVDTDKALAWRHGRLVFEMAPLADVLARLQRYRPGYLLIGDDKLRDLKVSGTFQLDRLDEGLAALEQAFPLKIQRYTDYLLVLDARSLP
ncbi:iron dicitrate transport regulator FecR [Stutzerimonas kirkiae]|uniref:Iron dicitrate transport regulator FecR n=1 Tax=Stutzerimonas kirkiae TaxID=2211392 RepID=A0A4V2KBV7_9GAMM|nr:FecR family protein [Stutzerimonas kirkiae]TBU89291.1 iron dicitrate transport regulator FecR [Stutzerimonas kirkiae]TBU99667.1 iron dicitrate transport regulator FecR [Stutzerimonas kirkiae]TBV12596.1 iron dicitrate transport regulator FecR [Stutzerimonas kirkiae]